MQNSRIPAGSGTLDPSLPARPRAGIKMYFDAALAARASGRTVGEVVGYAHSGVPIGDREEVTSYASAMIDPA